MVFLFLLSMIDIAFANELIITNNIRIVYDFDYDIKPYVSNEFKFISDGVNTTFDANKLRLGFRYKVNDYVRIDPHVFVDHKRNYNWVFSPGPAIRVDFTY